LYLDFYLFLDNFLLNDFFSLFLNYYFFNSFEFVLIAFLLFFGSLICIFLNFLLKYKNFDTELYSNMYFGFFLNNFSGNLLRKQNLVKQTNGYSSLRIFKKKFNNGTKG
jgi:hypothetical protein